jgi:hypothetical protein
MEPSPFELPIAEMPTRVDLAPRVLWMDDCYLSLHTIWAPSIALSLVHLSIRDFPPTVDMLIWMDRDH